MKHVDEERRLAIVREKAAMENYKRLKAKRIELLHAMDADLALALAAAHEAQLALSRLKDPR